MHYQFSKKIDSLQPSAIREILKATADPSVISFAAGNPAPEAFPIEAVQKITLRDLRRKPDFGAAVFGYGRVSAHCGTVWFIW